MGADFSLSHFLNKMDCSGQSVVELILLFPVLFVFASLMYKTNMASQVAINNAKFVRSQLFILTGNSAEYPRLQFRFQLFGKGRSFAAQNHSRMLVGIADPSEAQKYDDDDVELRPIPAMIDIRRNRGALSGSEDVGEPNRRTNVRLRNTASICTQFNSAQQGNKARDWTPDLVRDMSNEDGTRRWPFGNNTVCKYEDQEG